MKRILLLLLLSNFNLVEARELSGASSTGNQNRNTYEILGRLEQLQSEMQQMRGTIEEQNHTIDELKRRQQNIYSDVDQRLQILEGTGSSSTVENEYNPQPDVEAVTQPPRKLSKTQLRKEKGAYQLAYETLRNGRNAEAISLFKQFLVDFPAGEYADNAQYWLAEAYKVSQDDDLARDAFQELIKHYPNSRKVPDAMLKLGYIEFEQKNMVLAREILTNITIRYPGTTAAHLAERKLDQLDRY